MNDKPPRIIWMDNLRVLAVIGVVVLHVTPNPEYHSSSFGSYTWWVYNVYISLCRFCVPVFVMLTGALILGKRIALINFYKDKTLRILLPFVFWSFLYIFFELNFNTANELNGIQLLRFFIDKFIHGASFHLWYVYMIIGLYLFIPFMNKWLINSEKVELKIFLAIWIVTLFLNMPYFRKYGVQNYLYLFNGYIGYLVLGYYLTNELTINKKQALNFSIILILAGFFLTLFGTSYFSWRESSFQGFLYDYLSPNVMILSTGIFILFRFCIGSIKNVDMIVFSVSKYSYGIYLCHVLVLYTCIYLNVKPDSINVSIGIPLLTFLCIASSWALVCSANKIPMIKKVAGK